MTDEEISQIGRHAEKIRYAASRSRYEGAVKRAFRRQAIRESITAINGILVASYASVAPPAEVR